MVHRALTRLDLDLSAMFSEAYSEDYKIKYYHLKDVLIHINGGMSEFKSNPKAASVRVVMFIIDARYKNTLVKDITPVVVHHQL